MKKIVSVLLTVGLTLTLTGSFVSSASAFPPSPYVQTSAEFSSYQLSPFELANAVAAGFWSCLMHIEYNGVGGALAGSLFGPAGAAIGGVIGITYGAITGC